ISMSDVAGAVMLGQNRGKLNLYPQTIDYDGMPRLVVRYAFSSHRSVSGLARLLPLPLFKVVHHRVPKSLVDWRHHIVFREFGLVNDRDEPPPHVCDAFTAFDFVHPLGELLFQFHVQVVVSNKKSAPPRRAPIWTQVTTKSVACHTLRTTIFWPARTARRACCRP